MDKDRRQFLKLFAKGGMLIALMPVFPSAVFSLEAKKSFYAFIVDTEKCIGCGLCVRACQQENSVPDGCYRTWIERYTLFEDGAVAVDSPKGGKDGFNPSAADKKVMKSFFVPKLCNHCQKPNCVQVCPVGATYLTKDGFVLVDEKHCVGCSYCIQACAYGARFKNPRTMVADKCTWCFHRVRQGFSPACVTVCPVNARLFGRTDDRDGAVYTILRERRLQILKAEIGNEPMTFYIGLDKEVI